MLSATSLKILQQDVVQEFICAQWFSGLKRPVKKGQLAVEMQQDKFLLESAFSPNDSKALKAESWAENPLL